METFKALASSTRLQVLRALDDRRKTLSELAKELELNKATVHEHLGILLATGLIKKRDDEGRKWIYYELTWQGERLLHPQETTTFAVLLGFSVLAAGGGIAMLGAAMNWWWAEKQVDQGAMPEADEAPAGPQSAAAPEDSSGNAGAASESGEGARMVEGDNAPAASSDDGFFSLDDPDGILGLMLLVTAVLLAAFAFVMRRARRGSA